MTKTIVLRLIGVAILLFILIRGCVIPALKKLRESNLTQEEISYETNMAYAEYCSLFSATAKKGLKLEESYVSRSKRPYQFFLLNNNYVVLVYRVNIKHDTPLKTLIQKEEKSLPQSTNVVYAGYEMDDIKFSYSAEYDSIIDKICLSYFGDMLSEYVYGDSLISYNMSAENITLRYKEEGVRDIVFTSIGSKKTQINFNVCFLKKKMNVYFIIVYPRDKISVVKDFGYNLLKP